MSNDATFVETRLIPYNKDINSSLKNITAITQNGINPPDQSQYLEMALNLDKSKKSLLQPMGKLPWYKRAWDATLVYIRVHTSEEAKINQIITKSQILYEKAETVRKDLQEFANVMLENYNYMKGFAHTLSSELKNLAKIIENLPNENKDLESKIENLSADLNNPKIKELLLTVMESKDLDKALEKKELVLEKYKSTLAKNNHDLNLIETKIPIYTEIYERVAQQVDRWNQAILKLSADTTVVDALMMEYKGLTVPQIVLLEGSKRVQHLAEIGSQLSSTMDEIQNISEGSEYKESENIRSIKNGIADRTKLIAIIENIDEKYLK